LTCYAGTGPVVLLIRLTVDPLYVSGPEYPYQNTIETNDEHQKAEKIIVQAKKLTSLCPIKYTILKHHRYCIKKIQNFYTFPS